MIGKKFIQPRYSAITANRYNRYSLLFVLFPGEICNLSSVIHRPRSTIIIIVRPSICLSLYPSMIILFFFFFSDTDGLWMSPLIQPTTIIIFTREFVSRYTHRRNQQEALHQQAILSMASAALMQSNCQLFFQDLNLTCFEESSNWNLESDITSREGEERERERESEKWKQNYSPAECIRSP